MERESSRVESGQVNLPLRCVKRLSEMIGYNTGARTGWLPTASFTDIQPAIESLYYLTGFAALG
jgi:hypothetical protein